MGVHRAQSPKGRSEYKVTDIRRLLQELASDRSPDTARFLDTDTRLFLTAAVHALRRMDAYADSGDVYWTSWASRLLDAETEVAQLRIDVEDLWWEALLDGQHEVLAGWLENRWLAD